MKVVSVTVAILLVAAAVHALDNKELDGNHAVHPKVKANKIDDGHKYLTEQKAKGKDAGVSTSAADYADAARLLKEKAEHERIEQLQAAEHKFMLKRLASQKKRAAQAAEAHKRELAMRHDEEMAAAALQMKRRAAEARQLDEEIRRREELEQRAAKEEAEQEREAAAKKALRDDRARLAKARAQEQAQAKAEEQKMADIQAKRDEQRRTLEHELAEAKQHVGRAPNAVPVNHPVIPASHPQEPPFQSLFKVMNDVTHPSPEAQKDITDTLSNVLDHVLHIEGDSDSASSLHSAIEHGVELGKEIANDIIGHPHAADDEESNPDDQDDDEDMDDSDDDETDSDDDEVDSGDDAEDVDDESAQDAEPDHAPEEEEHEIHFEPLTLRHRPSTLLGEHEVPHFLRFPAHLFMHPAPPMFPEHMRPFPSLPLPPLPLMAQAPVHAKMLVLWPPHFNPEHVLEHPPVEEAMHAPTIFPRIMSLVNKLTALRPKIQHEAEKPAVPRELHIHGQTLDGRDCQCKCTPKAARDPKAPTPFATRASPTPCVARRERCHSMCVTKFNGQTARLALCNSRCEESLPCRAASGPSKCVEGCAKVPNKVARELCLKRC